MGIAPLKGFNLVKKGFSRTDRDCGERLSLLYMEALSQPSFALPRACVCYSIFELSDNTTSGAPSFVRSLRKGWETTDIHRNCKHPGRKRSSRAISHAKLTGL